MKPHLESLFRRGAPVLLLGTLGLQLLLSFSAPSAWAGWSLQSAWMRRGLEALQGEALLRSLPFFLLVLGMLALRREGFRGPWPRRLEAWGWGLLAGAALLGFLFARDSRHDLRPGEAVESRGHMFRLVASEADPKPEGLALAILAPDGRGGFEAPRMAQPVEVGMDLETGLGALRAQVLEVLPNALPEGGMVEDPEGPEQPALQVMLGLGGGPVLEGWLPARDALRHRFDPPGGAFAVLFRERFEPELVASLRSRGPVSARLVLLVEGRTLSHPAEPGSRWDLPGFSLDVEAVYPDFEAQPGPEGRPTFRTRSEHPRNPWVQVRLRQAGGASAQLLLAAVPPLDPSYAAYLRAALPPGVELRYVREGEERQDRFVLFTDQDRRVRLIQEGRVVREAPLELRKPFVVAQGLSAVPMARLARARFEDRWRPHPDPAQARQMLNPAVHVKVSEPGGQAQSAWVTLGGEARAFLGGRLGLRLQPRVAGPGTTRAQVGVGVEAPVRVTVTSPLRRGLTAVSVDLEAPLDPTRTRLRLTWDPGRPFRLLGLALVLVGWLAATFPSVGAGKGR